VLRGRRDRPRPAPTSPAGPARPPRTRLVARTALACFVAGAGFTVLGPGPALLAIGIVLLLAAAVLGFLAAVPVPDEAAS
jgi:hypothetical protein